MPQWVWGGAPAGFGSKPDTLLGLGFGGSRGIGAELQWVLGRSRSGVWGQAPTEAEAEPQQQGIHNFAKKMHTITYQNDRIQIL